MANFMGFSACCLLFSSFYLDIRSCRPFFCPRELHHCTRITILTYLLIRFWPGALCILVGERSNEWRNGKKIEPNDDEIRKSRIRNDVKRSSRQSDRSWENTDCRQPPLLFRPWLGFAQVFVQPNLLPYLAKVRFLCVCTLPPVFRRFIQLRVGSLK